jgi:isoquinoline 1-oxidoreductase subunit alpha
MATQEYRLNVNGRNRAVRADADEPLLWVLREQLGLTGTKFGCGIGVCGACTIHFDGGATRSCLLPMSAVGDHRVKTIEAPGRELDAVRYAWVREQVPQCGYCQSGQLMSAAALLAQIPNPTDSQIDSAMWGNICRCGTYPRIRRAIRAAASKLREASRRDD